jgi:virulence factor
MQKIGIIGLGDIADKAYLPIISQKNIELHLCTRNEQRLTRTAEQYRLKNLYTDVDLLLETDISAAFVHTATSSHEEIIEKLLSRNIHVYVDKPITSDLKSTARLLQMAQEKKLILMVGFNRRFAPAYSKLKLSADVNMIIFQKNRKALPGEIRKFIFDDFIHVVDTLLFLFSKPFSEVIVTGKRKEGLLYHVTMQLIAADGSTAIGIMNRDSGAVEEKLEVFATSQKHIVNNLVEEITLRDAEEIKVKTNDWEPTLTKRGFLQIIDHFLSKVHSGKTATTDYEEALLTHQVCEMVIEKLSQVPD